MRSSSPDIGARASPTALSYRTGQGGHEARSRCSWSEPFAFAGLLGLAMRFPDPNFQAADALVSCCIGTTVDACVVSCCVQAALPLPPQHIQPLLFPLNLATDLHTAAAAADAADAADAPVVAC